MGNCYYLLLTTKKNRLIWRLSFKGIFINVSFFHYAGHYRGHFFYILAPGYS